MTDEESEALKTLVDLDIAEGWKIDRLVDFINERNVDEVIDALPAELRRAFIFACENVYDLDQGPTAISIPDSSARHDPRSFRAIRSWLERNR